MRTDFDSVALVVEGGIGRCIAATAVVRCLAAAHPGKRLVVVTGWPDPFIGNPHVARIYRIGDPQHFFEDEVLGRRTWVAHVEPYRHPDYVNAERHLVDCWCDLLGVEYDGGTPTLFLTPGELDQGKAAMAKARRPVVLMQASGGPVPATQDLDRLIEVRRRMHRRNLPLNIAGQVANALMAKGYHVALVRHQNQPALAGVESVTGPLRTIFALVPFAKHLVLIDSFMQDAAAALQRPAVVCWGGTSYKRLGWDLHTNIEQDTGCPTPRCHRPNSYLWDRDANGNPWDCPYGDKCMNQFDPKGILAALGESETQKGEPDATQSGPGGR